jgi:hypothetical protein
MTKIDWTEISSVGDKSDYIVKITEILLKFAKNISTVLNEDYLHNLLIKIAEYSLYRSIANKFVASIYKCKKIGEVGTQQIQLDCVELKVKFLDLNKESSSFTSIVKKIFSKCESLSKIISSPLDSISENYYTLIENPNPTDLEKIIALVSYKKSENNEPKSKKLWNFKQS